MVATELPTPAKGERDIEALLKIELQFEKAHQESFNSPKKRKSTSTPKTPKEPKERKIVVKPIKEKKTVEGRSDPAEPKIFKTIPRGQPRKVVNKKIYFFIVFCFIFCVPKLLANYFLLQKRKELFLILLVCHFKGRSVHEFLKTLT